MGLVTHSEKRNRTYQRKFDHEEAVRLRKEGATYTELAERYGVTPMTVRRVVLKLYSAVGDGYDNE